jgi:hypothetical protein
VIPQQLTTLQDTEAKMWRAIFTPYQRICSHPLPASLTPAESMRRELLDAFSDLEDICYQDYFMEDSAVRLPPQEVWMPQLNKVCELIEQFQDREELTATLNNWREAHQIYRSWVVVVDITQGMLGNMYFAEGEDEREETD